MIEKKRVTIKDVARHAGVSPGAVSRVLHGKTSTIRVSEITAELIRKAAAELDYRPNAVAQSLRSGKTYHLALASHDELTLSGEKGLLIENLIHEAGKFGYSIILSSRFFGSRIRQEPLRGNFDAVIWLGTPSEDVAEHLAPSLQVPCACINSDPSQWPESTRHWTTIDGVLPLRELVADLIAEKVSA